MSSIHCDGEVREVEKTVRIAFISLWPPKNAKYWSGTPYYSYRAICDRFSNVYLIDTPIVDFLLFYANKAARRLKIDPLREPVVRRIYKALVARKITAARADILISVGASHKLCDLERDVPIIHATDALFGSIVESYTSLSRLSSRSKRFGEDIQRSFLRKVTVLCLSSDWAVESATAHYELSKCRVKMLPMGANLDDDPGVDLDARSSLKRLSLLFVGGDWERKGGPLLMEIFKRIQTRHPDAELNIVGCRPSLRESLPGVKVHGFLRKSDRGEARLLASLFRRSTFLAVPSRQEAFGLVYCEACAHGLPSIATRTGGVGSIVIDDVNGLLFSLDDPPEKYAERILAAWSDPERYMRMSSAARYHYEKRLSWNAWAQTVAKEVEWALRGVR